MLIEIIGVILFALFVFMLVGLGMITRALFNLSSGGKTDETSANQLILQYVTSKPTAANYSQAEKEAEILAVPKQPNFIPDGTKILDLGNYEIIVVKISLIAFWVLSGIIILFGLSTIISLS